MRLLPVAPRKPRLSTPGAARLDGSCRRVRWAGALLTVGLGVAFAQTILAGLLPGNTWPNPTLETDTDTDGVPNFWHRGGSDSLIDAWTTARSVSPAHSFYLNDASPLAYGEWYSDRLNITGGTNYQLRYNLRYTITNVGPMRVTVNFYTAADAYISGVSYQFSGALDLWEEFTQSFTAPASAAKLNLSFTSGGGVDVTGQAWLDDVSLAMAADLDSLVPYLENFPWLPNPLVIRNWKQTALDYHQFAFNPSITGQYLPLVYEYTANTAGVLRAGVRSAKLRRQSARQRRGPHCTRRRSGRHARGPEHGVAQRSRPCPTM